MISARVLPSCRPRKVHRELGLTRRVLQDVGGLGSKWGAQVPASGGRHTGLRSLSGGEGMWSLKADWTSGFWPLELPLSDFSKE